MKDPKHVKTKKFGTFRRLKYNIWMYFIIYTVIIIVTVWILQMVFLDSSYQKIRRQSLIETGNELLELVDEDNESSFNKLTEKRVNRAIEANESGIFVYLVRLDEIPEGSGEKKHRTFTVESLYTSALYRDEGIQSAGPQNFNFEGAIDRFESGEGVVSKGYLCDYIKDTDAVEKHCMYVSKVHIPKGEYYLFLISSNKALTETINLIQYQLVSVTLIVIALSFILAWAISTKLSEPIQRMSATANRWAKGDSSVVFRGTSYDELNELAEALNYAKEGIAKTGRLQRDLLANVSHDLKTPLTMIKAYAEMIRDISGENKEKRDIHTEVIIDEADRLTMLVNDILDLSKLQNDNAAPVRDTVNLSELCERVIYRFSNFMEQAGYKIINDVDSDLFTECDEQRIEQVVYNLIGNSLNYTGEDKTVTVHLHRQGKIILLEIVDSGKGIPKEQIDGIWERYYRFSETHQRPVKGTGLGLSIVKTILQSQGFKFGVLSKKDFGSNFFVEFPPMRDELYDAETAEDATETKQGDRQKTKAKGREKGHSGEKRPETDGEEEYNDAKKG